MKRNKTVRRPKAWSDQEKQQLERLAKAMSVHPRSPLLLVAILPQSDEWRARWDSAEKGCSKLNLGRGDVGCIAGVGQS
jgi:hypothetical protein